MNYFKIVVFVCVEGADLGVGMGGGGVGGGMGLIYFLALLCHVTAELFKC